MARIERATSPLPRECSTTEPHGHRHWLGHGREAFVQTAVDSNCRFPTCTSDVLLLSCRLPQHLERETGIEPASLAWKARVLPLNYSRLEPGTVFAHLLGGGGWIRTSVRVSGQIYSL